MKDWREFKSYLETTPVIDTHEHYAGKIVSEKKVYQEVIGYSMNSDDIFARILGWYMKDDMSCVAGSEDILFHALFDEKKAFDEKCDIFFKYYNPVKHTGYADAMMRGMKIAWDVDITYDGLHALNERKSSHTQEFCDALINDANIKLAVCDVFDIFGILNDGDTNYSNWAKFAISVPDFHSVKSRDEIRNLAKRMAPSSVINTLDDYVQAMDLCIKRCVDKGVFVAIKDQSPYIRKINYKNPTRYEAETIFNQLMYRPLYHGGTDETTPLDDYLYHQIVKIAGKYNLPFQHHTGHLAGLYKDVRGANAAHLTPVIEMYPNVIFDLFHGNWPYISEYLCLGKSFPNVRLDLCWLHSIDPDYAVEMMRRIILTMPTTHVSAFGGDTFWAEHQVGALDQARENVARAMCSLIDDGKLDEPEAKRIAHEWFFSNPNRIFNLGL